MKLSNFDYELPDSLIANEPASPRDSAKMMVVDRNTGGIEHKHFFNLPEILTENDVLVLNNTKVIPARMYGYRETGGEVEILLLRPEGRNKYLVLGKNLPKVGQDVLFEDIRGSIKEKTDEGTIIRFNMPNKDLQKALETHGVMPIPPYIKTSLDETKLRKEYQTIFASKAGSIAAPTAGLHLTRQNLRDLKKKGVKILTLTLHVGSGTFLPIKTDELEDHKMHSEYYQIFKKELDIILEAKKSGKRIIAVGTTTARALESYAKTKQTSGHTSIFIYPPYKFELVDSLITNFHLPHSTLLALVSAFVSQPNTGHEFIDFKSTILGKAYDEAIKNGYRFYSFGDGMIIG